MTGWEMTAVLLIIGIALAFIFAVNNFWRNEVRKEMRFRKEWQKLAHDLERDCKYYKSLSDDLIKKHSYLINENRELRYKMNNYMTPMCNEDMLYAVKYAMKHAHPDKGGNTDDFIRFREMYENLKH